MTGILPRSALISQDGGWGGEGEGVRSLAADSLAQLARLAGPAP